MTNILAQFHFLRPAWLFALLALLPLIILLWRQHKQAGQWQHLIAPELLPFLLEGKTLRTSPFKLLMLALAWIITCIALAGPSWQKLPVAVEKNQQALVIILDLSPSMLTEDIKPSRTVRARLKITDLLRERADGQTALLVYGANAHVVTPLTDDVKTISNLLPMLTPAIMPASGSNTEEAINRALQLLQDAQMTSGDLLLITDGIAEEALYTIKETLAKHPNIHLSILGVGGIEPAPIPSRNGGFLRDKENNIVTSYLDVPPLRKLAESFGGRYKTLSNDPTEMQLFTQSAHMDAEKKSETQKKSNEFDQWADAGYWLVFLLLPFIAFAFRRGVLLTFLLLPCLLATPDTSYALSWDELWKNQNQRAFDKLQTNKAEEAAKEFTREDWKAAAEYRAGNYDAATQSFTKDNSATGHYNRGNALAKANKLQDAIKAYDEALKQQPDMEDAKSNRKIVEEALKKQEEQKQQQQNQQDQNDQDQNQKDQDKKDQDKKDQDKQDQDQKDQDKKDQQQNSSESPQQDQNQQDQNQQNSSASQSQGQQESQNTSAGQNSSSGQNTSAGQSASASSTANESMQDSFEKNQQAESSVASQAAMPMANSSASATSEDAQNMAQPIPDDGLTDEERKQLEQWLRRVQDDPSGLLRRKFEYENAKQRRDKMNGTWEAPDNDADQRL